jgi:hypothetical protein
MIEAISYEDGVLVITRQSACTAESSRMIFTSVIWLLHSLDG